jgi:hypothetical protein
MFKKLIQKIRDIADGRKTFDPSLFGDPIAMQTDWTPANSGGANFRTHKLVNVNSRRLEFRATIGAKLFFLSVLLFGMIFLLIGVGILLGFVYQFLSGGLSFDIETEIIPLLFGGLIFSLFGLIFSFFGGYLLYDGITPIVFDKQKGFFWKGRKSPDEVFDKKILPYFAKLEDIHALQLISKHCSKNDGSYYSYELNLVLENGKRINVVDHGNKNKLRKEANNLSAFLAKPVWDAIDMIMDLSNLTTSEF